MSITELYFFMVILPNLHEFSESAAMLIPIILLFVGLMMVTAGHAEKCDWVISFGRKSTKFGGIILAVLYLLFIVTPSNTQLYAVSGGYLATNTKEIGKLPENLVNAANAWLEKAKGAVEKESPKLNTIQRK